MNNGKHPLKMRIKYAFDNKMAEGFGPKVRLLLLTTLVFVFLVGLLSAVSHGGVREHFGEDFLRSFMYSLGKGGALNPDDAGLGLGYFVLMFLTIIYCMFFSAILIGLISNALRTKVDDLGKGRSHVIENDHILILGFNDATFVLVSELIEANRNLSKTQTVVILGDVSQTSMIEQLQKKKCWPKRKSKTRVVCRTGSIYNFDDLKRCSIETCKAVIINVENDFEAVKAIMACSFILKASFDEDNEPPFLVSIIQGDENLIEARLAAAGLDKNLLIILALNKVLARIMVHTSRQPGLSDVFTELFNFTGSEFYIIEHDPHYPKLYGQTLAEINHSIQASYVIGIKKKDGSVFLGNPMTTIFEKGDALIIIKEDDDPLVVKHHSARAVSTPTVLTMQPDTTNVLIIGVEPVLNDILTEYSKYLINGSSICIVDPDNNYPDYVSEATKERLHIGGIEVSIENYDMSQKKHINRLLNDYSPDCVVILAKEDAADLDAEDERIMRALIYLREYRNRTGKQFSITSEMLQTKNKELAAATEPDDFIISREFSALMMSQIAYNKRMAPLFEELLSSKGFEVYMKPAHWYLPLNEALDLISVCQVVAERGEIFLGLRQKKNGQYQPVKINPTKYHPSMRGLKEYTFGKDDYLIVLSDNSFFPGTKA